MARATVVASTVLKQPVVGGMSMYRSLGCRGRCAKCSGWQGWLGAGAGWGIVVRDKGRWPRIARLRSKGLSASSGLRDSCRADDSELPVPQCVHWVGQATELCLSSYCVLVLKHRTTTTTTTPYMFPTYPPSLRTDAGCRAPDNFSTISTN